MPPRLGHGASNPLEKILASLVSSTSKASAFSTTRDCQGSSRLRKDFKKWLSGPGTRYKRPRENSTNYLKPALPTVINNRPFPLNPLFQSSPVLSNSARELIWKKVMKDGETVKAVSAELGVDLRRVAAVVRLKEVEKEWIREGKRLATPYGRAVLNMLPVRSFTADQQNEPFEPINELHHHQLTRKQLFWPTSESRHFTRADAAAAFSPKMLPADLRVPHPELVEMERDLLKGMSPFEATARFKQAAEDSERAISEKQARAAALEEKRTIRVQTDRFEFRIKKFNSEDVGRDGRNPHAVGWRYGVPFQDRKRGHSVIPTQVPSDDSSRTRQRL